MPSFKLLLEDKGADLTKNLWDTNRFSQRRVQTGCPLHANSGNQSQNNWGCPPTPNFTNTFNSVCRNHESPRPVSRASQPGMVTIQPWTQPPDTYCRGFTIIIWHATWIVPFQPSLRWPYNISRKCFNLLQEVSLGRHYARRLLCNPCDRKMCSRDRSQAEMKKLSPIRYPIDNRLVPLDQKHIISLENHRTSRHEHWIT